MFCKKKSFWQRFTCTAKLKINGESEVKKYHLIVKSQPQNEDARRFLKPSRTFEKEVQMYGQVSFQLQTLETNP